jgi:hypothetical protein
VRPFNEGFSLCEPSFLKLSQPRGAESAERTRRQNGPGRPAQDYAVLMRCDNSEKGEVDEPQNRMG